MRVQAEQTKDCTCSGNVHINLAMNVSIIIIYLLYPHWCFSCKISGRCLPQTVGIYFNKEFSKQGLVTLGRLDAKALETFGSIKVCEDNKTFVFRVHQLLRALKRTEIALILRTCFHKREIPNSICLIFLLEEKNCLFPYTFQGIQ